MGSRGARRKPVILRSQSTNSLKHLAMQFAQLLIIALAPTVVSGSLRFAGQSKLDINQKVLIPT